MDDAIKDDGKHGVGERKEEEQEGKSTVADIDVTDYDDSHLVQLDRLGE